MRRLPIRARLTLGFVVAMAVALLAVGLVLRARFGAELLRGIDMDLRSRAQLIASAIASGRPPAVDTGSELIDPDEAFAQVLDVSGRIVATSSGVAAGPLLTTEDRDRAVWPSSFTRRVRGIDDPARLFAVNVAAGSGRLYVVVGSTLGDRQEAIARLTAILALLAPVALAVVAVAGWLLTGAALRPVERMRREAAAISVSELDRRLPVPQSSDEISRLGATLNEMLARLEESFRREGAFLDQASHELRTPVAVLKTELDLALSRARTREELERALRSASREADRLVRLAEDLLVLGRMRDGQLPVRKIPVDMVPFVEGIRTAWQGRARSADVTVVGDAEPMTASFDPSRVRQAVENLLDNACRYAGAGSSVVVSASPASGATLIEVRDSGRGFPPAILDGGIEPFSEACQDGAAASAGLGLAIVRAIAESHGGSLTVANGPDGGARATMTIP